MQILAIAIMNVHVFFVTWGVQILSAGSCKNLLVMQILAFDSCKNLFSTIFPLGELIHFLAVTNCKNLHVVQFFQLVPVKFCFYLFLQLKSTCVFLQLAIARTCVMCIFLRLATSFSYDTRSISYDAKKNGCLQYVSIAHIIKSSNTMIQMKCCTI